MKNIIFIAPPAAGKGTFSNLLKEKYNYVHISTGDILREAIASGNELGKKVKNIIDQGNLVDDELIINLVQEKLTEIEGKPFILDGFPRTLNQAKCLDSILNTDYEVIYLEIDKETAIKRIEGRFVCSCGASYNLNNPDFSPKVNGICDKCGEKLIKRNDDNYDCYIIRYDSFLKNAQPLFDYYQNKNKLHIIDVNRDTLDILNDISKVVAND